MHRDAHFKSNGVWVIATETQSKNNIPTSVRSLSKQANTQEMLNILGKALFKVYRQKNNQSPMFSVI